MIGTKSYSDGVRQVLLPAVLDYQSAVRTYDLFKEQAEEMIGLAAGDAAIAELGRQETLRSGHIGAYPSL